MSSFDDTVALNRSRLMGRVRQRDTAPEIAVRKVLHALGYRYRLCDRKLPGRPDIVFASRHKAIFVHGCFWHFHNCKLSKVPKTRSEFWSGKFYSNRERDARKNRQLIELGWTSLVVWQCQLEDSPALHRRLIEFLGPKPKGKP